MLARSLGMEPGGPRVICDGCGLVLNVRDDRPPPAWFLDGKPPKGWATTKREDGTRDDRCPRCRTRSSKL